MISPVIFDTSFIQMVKCSSSFIKVSMVCRSRLVINFFHFKEKFCVSARVGKTCEIISYSEDLVEKIISPVIFDTNRLFQR